jgi:hypothetical protein
MFVNREALIVDTLEITLPLEIEQGSVRQEMPDQGGFSDLPCTKYDGHG